MSLANSSLKKTMPTSVHISDKMTAEGSFTGGHSAIFAPKSRLSEVLNIIEDDQKHDDDDDDA